MMLMAFARSMTSTCRGPRPLMRLRRGRISLDHAFTPSAPLGLLLALQVHTHLPRQISPQNTPLSFAYLYM